MSVADSSVGSRKRKINTNFCFDLPNCKRIKCKFNHNKEELQEFNEMKALFTQRTMKSSSETFSNYIDRYFTRFFAPNVKNISGNDQFINLHRNGLATIGIAFGHEILLKNSKPTSINFSVNNGKDLSKNVVSGKKKKGGFFVLQDSPLCEITLNDGSKHILYGCIRGRLVEVNPRLKENPGLLVSHPETLGYICIVMPKNEELPKITRDLLTLDEYKLQMKDK